MPWKWKPVYLRTDKNSVFTSTFIGTVKFVVLYSEVSEVEVSQNYENWQGMDVPCKMQRMEMTQNEIKIVLERKGLED